MGNMLNVYGLYGPFTCLNDARLGISFGVLGAETCIKIALSMQKIGKYSANTS